MCMLWCRACVHVVWDGCFWRWCSPKPNLLSLDLELCFYIYMYIYIYIPQDDFLKKSENSITLFRPLNQLAHVSNIRDKQRFQNSEQLPRSRAPCASVSAVGVLGKLILQVTDSLLLWQNCGLQVLNLLQQPLEQLRLEGGTEERGERETEQNDSDRKGEIKD